MTSPHTCHHGDNCPTEPTDPAFTVLFEVDLTLTCGPTPTATVPAFNLPIACQQATAVLVQDVIGGEVTGQLEAAAIQFAEKTLVQAASVAATSGASLPEAAAAFVADAANVAVKGLGTLIAFVDDQHLRNSVSAWLSIGGVRHAQCERRERQCRLQPVLREPLPRRARRPAPLPDRHRPGSLARFRTALPGAGEAADQEHRGIQQRRQHHLANDRGLAAGGAGGPDLPVTASDFRGTYVNTITVAWNKTMIGKTKSTLEWGPPPVSITTPALTFDATNLKPATGYGFRVHECDGITCAPWSDLLTTKTEPGGSNLVTFWLDNDNAHPVGSSSAPPSGGNFVANVKIPPATAPGPHVLHAGMYGRPPANAQITVCQPGGCAATIAVVNTSNNTLYPPGENVGAVVSGGGARLTLRAGRRGRGVRRHGQGPARRHRRRGSARQFPGNFQYADGRTGPT